MTTARGGSSTGATSGRARDLHRKLLERVLVRSDTQNIKDVFRRYDRERAGVLTVEQFRALVRDHDFLDADVELLLRYLGAKDQANVTFHAFMGDVQLGADQSYMGKNGSAGASPKKVQQLSHLTETQQKRNAQTKSKGRDGAKTTKPVVAQVQDPMEAIRTKLRERVMGHSKSIREVFMEYDVDGSGYLDYEEFGRFMAKYKFSPHETQTIVDYLDRDSSGTIDYDEFAAGLLFYRPPVAAPAAPVQMASSPAKSSDNPAPPKASQPSPTQSVQNSQTTKQPDLQQIVDSIRVKFNETLKRTKERTGRSRDLRAEFDNYDVDDSGSLDHQEFGALLVGLGVKLKAHELRTVLQDVDPDEEESIGFEAIAKLLGVQETGRATSKGLARVEEQRQQQASSKQNDEASVAFNRYDRDGSGELEYEEFRRLMHASGVADDQAIDALIDEIDADGSGSISFDEFARVYDSRIKRTSTVESEVAAAFSKYDRDGSGELDYTEFRKLMHGCGVKDNDAIDALIDEIDEDGSGSISFAEFARVYDQRIKPAVQNDGDASSVFSRYDRDGSGELEYDEFRRMMHESGVKDSEAIDALIDEIDKDRSGAISLSEFSRVYDRRIKPALKSTRQRRDQAATTRNESRSGPTKTARKASHVETQKSAKSRLEDLQEQELQFMERVLRRHSSIENAFREFDRDGRNEMDFEQFRDFMSQYGITDEASISMLLKRLDADNSGMIDLHEFLSVFNAQRLTRQKGVVRNAARGDQRQNPPGNGRTKRPARQGAKPDTTTEPSEPPDTRTAKTNKAARLRELEERWIRGALDGHDSVRSAFAAVDRDHDGEITHDEFRKLMNQFGVHDDEDVAAMMKKVDADGNGCIEYEEFASVFHETRVKREQDRRQSVTAIPRRSSVAKPVVEAKNARGARLRDLQIKWMKRVLSCHESIESAFYQYDNDGNGELDHEEFLHFMKRYGIVKDDDINALLKRLDTDYSGRISFDEFSVIFNPLRIHPGSTAEGISAMAAAANEELFDPEELESILEIERELAERMAHQTRDLRLAFRKFDTNGNGLLEYKEFRSVLKSYRLPEMEIRKVIRHLDRDVSGFIDYKEFIAGFGAFKESGGGAAPAASTQKKAGKRASPGKGNGSKPKTHFRRSPAKPQGRSKTSSVEALKKTMHERILAIHGTVQGAFREYDLDKEGCLNEAQFVKLVLDCGFSRDEAARLLDAFDQDQSGAVEYQEFLAQLVVKGGS
jgi:Ca2+-binding EF-hand superfamily protein